MRQSSESSLTIPLIGEVCHQNVLDPCCPLTINFLLLFWHSSIINVSHFIDSEGNINPESIDDIKKIGVWMLEVSVESKIM